MTIENWLVIGVIVATLIAPLLPALVTRLTREKPKAGRRLGWLPRFLQSPLGLPPAVILINLYLLVSEVRSTAPITRMAIYQISASVAGIFYGLALFLLNTAWQAIRHQWEINLDQAKTDVEIMDILKKVIDNLQATAENVHTTAQTIAIAQETQQLQTEIEKARQKKKLLPRIRGLFGD